jgi:hypothetical protein
MTKVAGDVKFSLNISAAVKTSLDAARIVLFDLIERIENERGSHLRAGHRGWDDTD